MVHFQQMQNLFRRHTFITALVASAGAFFAALIWLWVQFGTDVVLAYAQGVALMCF